MTFEPKHDVSRLGPLKADPADEAAPGGALCSLIDLVAWVMHRDGLPRRPAAAAVVDELARATPPLYLTNCDTWATRSPVEYVWRQAVEERAGRVGEQVATRAGNWATDWGQIDCGSRFELRRTVVKPRAASPGAYGDPGALQMLHEAWCHDDVATRDKAMKAHGAMLERLAIPLRVAVELLGYGSPAIAAPGASDAARSADAETLAGIGTDSRIVQPKGSTWSHKKGDKWSAAEKEAMRAMRAAGMTDAEIAGEVGCTRQVVGQQIMSTTAARADEARERGIARLAA